MPNRLAEIIATFDESDITASLLPPQELGHILKNNTTLDLDKLSSQILGDMESKQISYATALFERVPAFPQNPFRSGTAPYNAWQNPSYRAA